MGLTRLFLLSVLCVGATLAVKSEILSPVRNSGVEAALIIVPGADINGGRYKPLAQEIQKTSNLKLWVALLEDFPLNLPNPLQLNGAISAAISSIKKAGMTTNNVFVAGHSLGGVFVGNYGKSNPVKGILLLASYLTKGNPLTKYPVPVLTISGDLDGLTRCTRIADTFQELKADVAKTPSSMYRSPVVIMPGVNHGQFASGAMPSNVLNYDLKPEVGLATAHKLIAGHVANFLVTSIGGSSSAITVAKAGLASAYRATDIFFTPLLAMKTNDVNPQGFSNWTVQAQYIVSGLGRAILKVTNQEQSEFPFIGAKPEVKTQQHFETIKTHTHIINPGNVMDVSTVKNTPDSLDVKLKSKAAVFVALPKGFTPPATDNKTCMDINKAAWAFALRSSSATARKRYLKSGRPMKFVADSVYNTGITWVMSSPSWKETTSDVTFQSTALLSKVHMFPESFAGMHYCKLLSPYRAMEWIYVDSLRHKVNSGFLFG